ncbi:flippase [Haloarchaeobius sp. HRN-SO-5]|uniref:flippase n=1 Tax=Haloarchaeobius sp. HRN-SO-5 TaxID=3446118 RepID=UPI003EBB69FE
MTKVADSLGKLAESASVVFVGSIVGRALGLVGETAIIRALPPSAFGEVALAYTVVFALANITLLGVHDGVTRFLSAADDSVERLSILRSALIITLVAAVISILGLYFLRNWLAGLMGQPSLTKWIPFFLIFFILYPLARIAFGVLRGQGRTVGAVLSKKIGARVFALGLLAIATFTISSEIGAVAYWISFQFFILFFCTLLLRQRYQLRKVVGIPDSRTLNRLWSFSWPLATSSVIFLMLSNMDVLMIGYFLDSTSVGYYRSIQPLKQATTFVVSSFSFLYLPIATEYYESGDLGGLNELFTVTTKWISLATLPFVLVFTFFASDAIAAIFGAAYTPASSALAVLIGGLFIRALSGLDGDMVRAIDRPKVELYSAAGGLSVNFGLNIVLITQYGLVGAAVATVTGYAVYNGLEVIAIYRQTGASPVGWNVLKPLFPTTLLAIVAAIILPDNLGLLALIGLGMFFTMTLPISVFLTRSFDRTDIELVEMVERHSGADLGTFKQGIQWQLVQNE